MAYKRILTIQDISCVGQCSMTVALPILSACGHETCILPTAVLSTHTGGFGKPVVSHLDTVLLDIWRHWKENDITFDAILVGYLGSVPAIETVMEIADALLAPGGMLIVDPAMADHGKYYSGFDESYAQAMKVLCRKADIIIPNITEAAMLSGKEYRTVLDENYVNELVRCYDRCWLWFGADRYCCVDRGGCASLRTSPCRQKLPRHRGYLRFLLYRSFHAGKNHCGIRKNSG